MADQSAEQPVPPPRAESAEQAPAPLTYNEAIRILLSGDAAVQDWNARRERGEQIPSLAGAYLRGASLPRANLRGLDLRGADLQDADLTAADLCEADLRGASLTCARLHGTVLSCAKLGGRDHRQVDFSESVIGGRGSLLAWPTWQTIRSVGSLQVLTKVSYFMLALVPILAGLWPGVRGAANQYNETVAEDARRVEEQIQKWREAVQGPAVPQAATARLDRILDGVQNYAHRLGHEKLDPWLPMSWALAFFSALCVAVGHLLYQLLAPPLVKEKTIEAFAAEVVAGFGETSPDRMDRLRRAIMAIHERARIDPGKWHPNLIRRHGRTIWIPGVPQWFSDPTPAVPPDDDAAPGQMTGAERTRIAIEEGAKAEYEIQASRRPWWALLALAFYVAAGVMITWLVVRQSISILRAVGWAV